ncbi:MAG: hypothetical protein M1831_004016 [Alyxoria varia]|nr:MAG: hypothetical protein M1831_004016 [Alyxoria varia]
MSQFTSSYSSQSYSSYSSSSTSGGQTTGSAYAQQSQTDPSGTKVQTKSQNLGEPVVSETRQYDAQGRPVLESSTASGGDRRIEGARVEDVTDEKDNEAARRYQERIEDEYAKREGGA